MRRTLRLLDKTLIERILPIKEPEIVARVICAYGLAHGDEGQAKACPT
jgi:hypothetical protein